MKTLVCLFALYALVGFTLPGPDFRAGQLKSERVQVAYRYHGEAVKRLLQKHRIPQDEPEIFIRILKSEKQVEVWGKGRRQSTFRLLREYSFCAVSGRLGPKRQQGDLQIPEGFYHINRFHPASNYHLSLGLNYPNRSDSILCTSAKPGNHIFIHGGCVTVGCIPITDQWIEELYVLAVEARHYGQQYIPVHIFPGRLDKSGYNQLAEKYAADKSLLSFWQNLCPGYEWFEKYRSLPPVQVLSNGLYQCGNR